MSIEDSYAFVHNTKSNIQGIGIKNGKYHGVIYEYKNVSFGTPEDEPDKEFILSFEYDVIDPFGFDREDFGKEEFANLLGDILVDVIDKYGTGEQFESDD